jgi:15,16-dihydrobiliverdin:ferredoxin oxidoreductase
LCVVDFQPIADHAASYEHLLKPIRDQYPSLQGKMSNRFYDENRFFSNQMLYSRFEELQQQQQLCLQQEHPAYRDLFPAYQQYVQTHLELIRSTKPNPLDIPRVTQGQAAYDSYSADRDPAHAMVTKIFGQAFADAFVYDVLFSYSDAAMRP